MYKKMLLVSVAALPFVVGAAGTPSAKGVLDGINIGTFSANVGVFSEYVFRGISQTDESPALQGGIDWEHDLGSIGDATGVGFHAGIWGSNVDFVGTMSETVELDLTAGFGGEFDTSEIFGPVPLQALSYDVGTIYYWYPGASRAMNLDFIEVYAALGLDFGYFSLGGSVNYAPEYTGNTDEAVFVEGTINVPLPYGLSLNGSVGHQSIQDDLTFGTESYVTWSFGAALDLATVHSNLDMFSVGVTYTGTDIRSNSPVCAGGRLCDDRVLFNLSAELGGSNS